MKKKIVTILLLLLMFLSSLFIFHNYNNTVHASIVGSWFKADFNIYTDGTKYINETIGGDRWLYINATDGNPDGIIDADNVYHVGTNHYTNFEVGGNFKYLSVNFSITNWNSGMNNIITFYGSNNVEIFNILQTFSYQIYLRKSSSTIYLGTKDISKGIWVNTTYNTNGTMQVNLVELSKTFCLDYGTESYIRKVNFTQGNDAHHLLKIGAFKVSEPLSMYPWESGLSTYETVGYVGDGVAETDTIIGGQHILNFPNDYQLLEQIYIKPANYDYHIKQIALSVGTYTDIANIDIYLYINGQNPIAMTTYYNNINLVSVLVWSDLDIYVTDNNIILEWFFADPNNLDDLAYHYTDDGIDIDDDGFSRHRRGDGQDAIDYKDGEYNAITSANSDLVYQMWFETSFDTSDSPWWVDWSYKGEFFNVSDYNGSETTYYNLNTTQHYFLLEQKYKTKYTDDINYIKQVSLALNNLSGKTDNISEIWLKVDGEWCGTYSFRSFHEDEYSIFTWDNLNIDVRNRVDIVFEWMINSPTGGDIPIIYANDTDNDGYSASRWYNGTDLYYDIYFDGLYNAPYNKNKDLIYNFFYSTTPEGETDTTSEDEEKAQSLNIILGLIVSFGIGLGLLLLTHNSTALFLGTGASIYTFSQPTLGAYQLLPNTVGIGLIVVLVVIGVILWFIK